MRPKSCRDPLGSLAAWITFANAAGGAGIGVLRRGWVSLDEVLMGTIFSDGRRGGFRQTPRSEKASVFYMKKPGRIVRAGYV